MHLQTTILFSISKCNPYLNKFCLNRFLSHKVVVTSVLALSVSVFFDRFFFDMITRRRERLAIQLGPPMASVKLQEK